MEVFWGLIVTAQSNATSATHLDHTAPSSKEQLRRKLVSK